MTRRNLLKHSVFIILFNIGILCDCLLEKTLTVETVPNSNVLNESRLIKQQKQFFKSNSVPEIDFDIYGEFPTIKYFDVFEDDRMLKGPYTRFRRSQDKDFLNGKQSILIRSRIYSPFNWDDKLNDSESYIYKLLSTSYCELLLHSFQIGSKNQLKQPDCIFLQFSKGSIVLNAMLDFNDVNYSLLSVQDLSKLLIEGSKELINAIINDKKFHLGFNFNGNFSLQSSMIKIKEESTVPLSTPSISPLPIPPSTVATMTTTVAMIHSEETDSHRRSTINETQLSDDVHHTTSPDMNVVENDTLPPKEIVITHYVALNFELAKEGEPLKWNENLSDVNSEIYQTTSKRVCDIVLDALNVSVLEDYKIKCLSVSFISGSVQVQVILQFTEVKNSTNNTESVSPLTEIVVNSITDYVNSTNNTNNLGISAQSNFAVANVDYDEETIINEPETTYSTEIIEHVFPTTYDNNQQSGAIISLSSQMINHYDKTTVKSSATNDESVNTQQPTVRISSFTESFSSTEDTVTYIVALNFKVQASNNSLAWDDDLLDTTSTVYQELYQKVCELLTVIMQSVSSVLWNIECGTITFKKGSIDVDAELILTINSTSNNTTYEPSSTVLNETSLIEAVNDYITTVDLNSTFGIYFDPNSMITGNMGSTIMQDSQVEIDVTSPATNKEDSDLLTASTNQFELMDESTADESILKNTSIRILEQIQSTEISRTPTPEAIGNLTTTMISRLLEGTSNTTYIFGISSDTSPSVYPIKTGRRKGRPKKKNQKIKMETKIAKISYRKENEGSKKKNNIEVDI
ncbi:hypothetical protein KSF78_0005131, partial [Schistosoma japonicum]